MLTLQQLNLSHFLSDGDFVEGGKTSFNVSDARGDLLEVKGHLLALSDKDGQVKASFEVIYEPIRLVVVAAYLESWLKCLILYSNRQKSSLMQSCLLAFAKSQGVYWGSCEDIGCWILNLSSL